VLPACSSGDAGATAPDPDDPLRVVGQLEVHSLEPATAGGVFTRLQVAETLVDAGTDGALRPGLSTRWASSAGGREWTFELRPGARFHDGTAVTPEHVARSLDVARRGAGTPLATVPFAAVDAVGGGDVRVVLQQPFAALPAVLAHTSAQVLAPSSYGADGAVEEVVGTGPYEVTSVQIPTRIDLTRSDDWTGAAPRIARVRYQTVGRAESRALLAESGQADVTFGMDPTSVQRLTGKDSLDVESVTVPRTILLKVNADHERLADVRVRRALSAALDREAMAAALLRDPEMAATQLFPPSLAEWHQDGLPSLEHDAARARALLTEAGWTPGPDGVLVRDGVRFEVALRTYPDRPELPVLATAVQAALKDVGIAVDVQVGNSSEIPAGHADGTLELGLYARNFSLVPDPLVTLLEDFDADGADFGAMGWSSSMVTARLGDLAAGATGDAAAAARRDVAQVLQDELPVIPVAWYRQSAVVSDRVTGVDLDPLERSYQLSRIRWTA
jgi:peptide/nickel transport system substrate-binding protein